MSDLQTAASAPLSLRRRVRPERLRLGDEDYVRNDVVAKDHGTTERSVNRLDAEGAPYIYLYGIKYRPINRYNQFLTSRIVVRGCQAPVEAAPEVRRRAR